MKTTNNVLIVLFSFLVVLAASASNRIQNIDVDFSGFPFLAHCLADDVLVVNEGETIKTLVRLPDTPFDDPIHLINRAVGQLRATGLTSGYEYIGSVLIAAEQLQLTPYPYSDTVNMVNGRGVGVFLVNVEWVAPSFPEVGVSMVKGLIVLTFQGGGITDVEIVQNSFKVECKGLALN